MLIKDYTPIKIISGMFVLYIILYFSPVFCKCHLIINPSQSVPSGIYFVKYGKNWQFNIGDYAEIKVPDEYKQYLYGRHWLLENQTLLKQIGALPNDEYCIFQTYFTINKIKIGKIFDKDSMGFPMPITLGCKVIEQGSFLPVATNIERSFDGRYMGAISQDFIIGKATPLWIF